MKFRRAIRIGAISVAVLVFARIGYAYYRFHAVSRDFDAVREGDAKDTVIAKLGRPNYHSGACLEDLHIAQDCSSELVYSDPLAPLLPEYYVVDFSPQGKVIATGNLNSP